MVKNLLIANVLVFLAVQALGTNSDFALQTILFPPSEEKFQVWQLVTHAFRHDGFQHLAFNMLGLYFLGPMVEQRIGPKKFLTLYFVALAGAVIFHLASPTISIWQMQQAYDVFMADPSLENFNAFFSGRDLRALVYGNQNAATAAGELEDLFAFGDYSGDVVAEASALMQQMMDYRRGAPMLGASGAVSGVAAAFAVLNPNTKLSPLFIPIGFPAKYFIPFLFLIDLVLGVLNLAGDNIAHFAHIGGAVFGALLAWYFVKTTVPPHMKRWS